MKVVFDISTGEYVVVENNEAIQSLEELREMKQAELMNLYKESIVMGFTSSVTGEAVKYGYKEQDQLNYSKLANLFALNPNKESTIVGSDSHGVVTLTREQFLKFMEDAEKYETDMYVKRKTLEHMINKASRDELNSITLSF